MGQMLTGAQAIAETMALLNYYGFELEGMTAQSVIQQWQALHPVEWIRPAVLEALYRGRYKKISVEEILRVWEKWGEPKLNFNSEFERLICAKLSDNLALNPPPDPAAPPLSPETSDRPVAELQPGTGIERFHPQPDVVSSDAYKKLKAIATQSDVAPSNTPDSP